MREERSFDRMRAIAASGLAPQLAAPEIVGVLVEALGIDCRPIALTFRPGTASRSSVWLEDGGVLEQVAQLADRDQPYHPPEIPILDGVVAGAAPLGSFAATLWGRNAQSSGPWEDLWRSHNSRHGVQSVFRSPGGKYGMLLLGRSGRTDTFKAGHLEAVDRTTRYLSRLADAMPEDYPGHEQLDSGSILFDGAGRACLMSEGVEVLLSRMGAPDEALPSQVGAIAYLSDIAGRVRAPTSQDAIANGSGTFRLSVRNMAGAGAQPMRLVAIERYVPTAFLVARGALRVRASGRQIELALRLARSETLATAAKALGVSHATCRYYLDELFNRTDTASQPAMLARLAALGRDGLA